MRSRRDGKKREGWLRRSRRRWPVECALCAPEKFQELEKGQREQSRSRSPHPRQFKLDKNRTGYEKVENEGGQNSKWKDWHEKVKKDCGQTSKWNDGKSHNEDCGP